MSVADELLAAVLADPSRAGCAVYADHLVELGDPRGELINLDLALESHSDPARIARRDQLLELHGERWWPGLVGGERVHGFYRQARVDAARVTPATLAGEPVHAVDVVGRGEPAIRGASWLPRLRRLSFGKLVAASAVREILLGEPLDDLVELTTTMPRGFWTQDLPVDWLPHLEVLELHGPSLSLAHFGTWRRRAQLRRLRGNHMEVEELCNLGPFPHLEELEAELHMLGLYRMLDRPDVFPALRTLTLLGTWIHVDEFVARMPRLPWVERTELGTRRWLGDESHLEILRVVERRR